MPALHETYRPDDWSAMFGQSAAVAAMEKIVKRRSSQAFLLHGPSGCGKTSLARIAARKLGCDKAGVTEIDGATFTGVDDMRKVREAIQYLPLGDNKSRAVILDEIHRVSGNAWDSLLKSVEEPPANMFWFFCTTNPDKVPTTIKTRCTSIKLGLLSKDQLTDLIESVCESEDIDLDNGIRQVIVANSNGSARQALVNLELCRDARGRQEALSLLNSAESNDVTIQLCRILAKGGVSWIGDIAPLLEKLKEENPEGIRIIVCNYMAAAAAKAKSDRDAVFFLNIIESFATPYSQGDGRAQLLRSIGQCVFS